MNEPLWRTYERQIYAALRKIAGAEAKVTFDARLPGLRSGIDRQIDVLVEGEFARLPQIHRMIVDCKKFSRVLDVTHVECFAGLVEDVGASLGLLVTTEGFTAAAHRRAANVRGLILDVVKLDDMAKWLPRHVTVATTAGSSAATLTFRDDDGQLKTEWVSLEFAQQLLRAQGRDQPH